MNIFEQIKGMLTAREVVEYYGIKVQRNGMCCCPFHNDKHPSMKVDKNYHCFGCRVGGDSIDFTSRYFGLTQFEAAKKLNEDFNLHINFGGFRTLKQDAEKKTTELTIQQRKEKIREKMELWLRKSIDVLIRYLKWINFWKNFYEPEPQEEWNDLFTEAVENDRKINDYLDILMFGSGYDIVEFFTERRGEVNRIEERVNEYQRRIVDEIGRYCGRGDV